jgi:large subunit ribosomal protein L40
MACALRKKRVNPVISENYNSPSPYVLFLQQPHTMSLLRRHTLQRRTYAIATGSSAPKDRDSTAGDSRADVIRKTLYPPSLAAGGGSSPTGVYHPDAQARLGMVLQGGEEVHGTISRAWAGHQRALRDQRHASLSAKAESMRRACDALKTADARLYAAAMVKPDIRKSSAAMPLKAQPEGGKTSLAEKRWKASRIEGLVPRELGVPRETWAGERWRYEWRAVE